MRLDLKILPYIVQGYSFFMDTTNIKHTKQLFLSEISYFSAITHTLLAPV